MPVPKSFDAAIIPEAGAASKVQQRSLAPLEPYEVAIKVSATGINPVDWKIRDYKAFLEKFPAVGGSDAAGEIVEAGPEVKGYKVGDRVFFQGIIGVNDSATFQQYLKLDHKLLGHTPDNITDDEAGGISLATMAALTAMYDVTGHNIHPHPWAQGGDQTGKGQAAVIIGGSSSVGQYAIQLARLSGYEKIITNASSKHADHLKKLGATTVLDRSSSSHDDFINAIGETPLAFVLDAISTPDTDVLAVQIAQGAKNTSNPRQVSRVMPNPSEKATKQAEQEPKVEFRPIMGMGSKKELRNISENAFPWLSGLLAKGQYIPNKPVVIEGGLAVLEKALDKNKAGVSGEKVIIRPFGP